MQVSLVIPVHNAAKYLGRCLDSLLKQTFLNNPKNRMEIILVNNNSTDDSVKIASEYVNKNSQLIQILDCENPGASATRNFGIREATGKYVWFIDADDYVKNDAVEKLYNEAERVEADLVMLGAERTLKSGEKAYLGAVKPSEPEFKHRFVRYGAAPWQFLIRRSWWLEHKIQFKEGIIHEDMELMSALILETKKYSAVDECLYYYCENPESVLHKTAWDGKYFDIFPALEGLYKKFESKKALDKFHDDLEYFFVWNLLIDSARDFRKFKEGKDGFKRSRKMLKQYFPHWRKNKFVRSKGYGFCFRAELAYFGI